MRCVRQASQSKSDRRIGASSRPPADSVDTGAVGKTAFLLPRSQVALRPSVGEVVRSPTQPSEPAIESEAVARMRCRPAADQAVCRFALESTARRPQVGDRQEARMEIARRIPGSTKSRIYVNILVAKITASRFNTALNPKNGPADTSLRVRPPRSGRGPPSR